MIGAPVTVAPNPGLIADRVEIVDRNASGTEVQRLDIPVSAEPVEWAGVGPDGQPFSPGLYTFSIVSYSGDDILISEQAEVYSTVTEVRSEGGQTILMLAGGVGVSAAAVTALRDPAYF